jgi:hypothetical protein
VNKAQHETLKAEWLAALDDAAFAVEQVRLYPFLGEPAAGNHAFYITPGQKVRFDPNFPDNVGGQIEDANEHLDHHRIAVWYDAPRRAVLGAQLRHELEHARQQAAHGNKIFDLNDLILSVLGVKLEGLKGGGQLYNANPIEVDANAASARFAWSRYGERKARALANPNTELGLKYGVLFRSLTASTPLETLPKRMLVFLFQFNDLCVAFAQKVGRPFEEMLAEAWPAMPEAWGKLQEIEILERSDEES